ncbi:unnamed protein product, partial [marine sediment metagenome]
MTNYRIEKIQDCLATILEQVEMLFYYDTLLKQRKLRLEKIEGRVLQIRDILKDEKKVFGKKSGKSKLKNKKSLVAPDSRQKIVMTNQQIRKIRHCSTAILDQVEFMSCQGRLSEQRKERLKEVKRQALKIKDILRGM